MSERERLIELIDESKALVHCGCHYNSVDYYNKKIADYLLANGVIVPPCKVGDTVYWIDENSIKYGLVTSIQMNSDETRFTALTDDLEEMEFEDFEIGNAIFPTKEAAEEALRGECERK